MTTIQLSGGPLGSETLTIRCDLSQASAPVQVDYGTGDGWEGTQYQCADARHCTSGLAAIGQRLADKATQTSGDACDWEEV
jgi:hypothetical protein